MKARDSHSCAPERCHTAMLLVDVINDFDFATAHQLLRYAKPAAGKIAGLKDRPGKKGVPAIYVNDNFGRWRSDFNKQVEHCIVPSSRGAIIARALVPTEEDYFVLKLKHSGFFSTTLEVLLRYLGARRLIITGFAADICVLYTATDAYMRDFEVVVPLDCVASKTITAKRQACAHLKRFAGADIRASRFIQP